MSDTQNETFFLTAPQVFERYQCSHMFVVALLKRDETFPRPTYLGRHRRWKISELEAWEKLQKAKGAPSKTGHRPPPKKKSADAA
jgi:predicted DNA-binding transcriptional regulator AlpA